MLHVNWRVLYYASHIRLSLSTIFVRDFFQLVLLYPYLPIPIHLQKGRKRLSEWENKYTIILQRFQQCLETIKVILVSMITKQWSLLMMVKILAALCYLWLLWNTFVHREFCRIAKILAIVLECFSLARRWWNVSLMYSRVQWVDWDF